MSEPVDYSAVLHEWLDLYANQKPRQAELVVPAWAFRRFNGLTEHERLKIMGEIDHIASLHGLQAPTKITVVAPPS